MLGVAFALASATGATCAERGAPAQYDAIIAKHSRANGVPEALIRRVIVRESRYNPRARNGPYWGMMQISVATARGAGFRGAPSQLLDADVNLRYAVRYLAGAYKVAGGDHGRAVGYYARGYYYAAKAKGLLAAIGMSRNGTLTPPKAEVEVQVAAAPETATPAPARVASLFGARTQPAPAASQPVTQALVPTPPSRGPAVGPTVAATSTAAPLPAPRGATPSRRTIEPSAPVLASVTPTPRPRDEPATTASITPRSGARQQVTPEPVLAEPATASTKPAPLPTPRDQRALAYAAPGRGADVPEMQPKSATPLPPRR